MRAVRSIPAAALLACLTACSDGYEVKGDAPPSTGPTVAQVTPAPTKAPKHRKKAKPGVIPATSPAPTPAIEPTLPPGEKFDPEHYDPEGDHDPNATPDASGLPAG